MQTLYCRRNIATLDSSEKRRFRDAVFRLMEQGRYEKYVELHGYVSNLGHSGPAFLPWHRAFLLTFEKELQTIDPGLTIPYWDFGSDNLDASGNSHIWSDDFFGGMAASNGGPVTVLWTAPNGSSQSFTVLRRNSNEDSAAVSRFSIDNALGIDEYGTIDELNSSTTVGFRKTLERGPHGAAHVFLGVPGSQGGSATTGFHTAVEDLAFMMLHSNIDRLWSIWQQRKRKEWLDANPGQPYPVSQAASDYHFDDLTVDTSWPPPSVSGISKHNIDDNMWPWDGSDDGSHSVSGDSSSFAPWNIPGQAISYTPRNMLSTVDLGYMFDDDTPSVSLVTPALDFIAVPEGDITSAAIVFDTYSCLNPATVQITAGPGSDFGVPFGPATTFTPAPGGEGGQARIWLTFPNNTSPGSTLPPAGTTVSSSVTVRCNDTNEEWTIPINGSVVNRLSVAASLVLDKSGSMGLDANLGSADSRMDVLKGAAPVFVDMLRATDGIAITSFNQDASPDLSLQMAGPNPFLGGKLAAKTTIGALTPGGATSIGDGIETGNTLLSGASGFDEHAIVVFTDGHENSAKTISEVSGLLNARTFAIGMGTPSQLRPAALADIVNQTGGYLMMTGDTQVDLLRLSKYFLQVLAGVTNNQIVLDPPGRVPPGEVRRIPFTISSLDSAMDVVCVMPQRGLFTIMLETPKGQVINSGNVVSAPGARFIESDNIGLYRMTLPSVHSGYPNHEGKWHVLLKPDEAGFARYLEGLKARKDSKEIEISQAHGAPFEVVVQVRSSLRMTADVIQKSKEIGSQVYIDVRLSQMDMPLSGPAVCWAEIMGPKGIENRVVLDSKGDGAYSGTFGAELPGSYRMRIRTRGQDYRGQPFEREQLRTASVWEGGDQPVPKDKSDLPKPTGDEAIDDNDTDDDRRDFPFAIDMDILREVISKRRIEINLGDLFRLRQL